MSLNLFAASHQWSTRPADERFTSLRAMVDACKAYANTAREVVRNWSDLSVVADGENVNLVGPGGTANGARLTHYAFGALSRAVEAPASFLRTLPAPLAADVLNDRIKTVRNDPEDTAALLFHQNGNLLARAITSERYARIWNWEVCERLETVAERCNLEPARQTFSWDGSPVVVTPDMDRSLYASDHDMFAFLMSEETTLTDPMGKTLRRGIIVTNSEVGAASLKITGFYFRDVCCNHIIWGAQDIAEVSLKHIGEIRQRWIDAQVNVRKYMEGSAESAQAKFAELTVRIAGERKDVIDTLFGIRALGLSKKDLTASYDAVIADVDGDPRSVWGMAQGITRHSQTIAYTDARHDIDRAAGRLLSMADKF